MKNTKTLTMKRLLPIGVFLILAFVAFKFTTQKEQSSIIADENITKVKKSKKTPEERALFSEERARYEYELQANPATGLIPQDEKRKEFLNSQKAKIRLDGGDGLRAPEASFVNRGPSNLGGRTRAIVPDVANSNIILAGGVSGGLFRSTDSGASWTKVSENDEIHNVTTIAQDPTNTSTWYYGTGEGLGNSTSQAGGSAGFGSQFYKGQGIWKSTDNGQNWAPMVGTFAGTFENYDNYFDIIYKLEVHPATGDVFAAVGGRIYRFDAGTSTWGIELQNSGGSTNFATDLVITDDGEVYTAFSGNQDAAIEGVWYSANGEGSWTRITDGVTNGSGTALHTRLVGRAVLGLGPDPDGAGGQKQYLYLLYVNGFTPTEADLWRYAPLLPPTFGSWVDFSAKLPLEAGVASARNFAVQGGYDLVINVKPDNQNFVVIGGTNAYKIADIDADPTFTRIGGYAGPTGYAKYANSHPDIHALNFNPHNVNELFSGDDGGIRKTTDINAATVVWTSLNNNYQTQQFYHVAIDPLSGSDYVVGGLQDNGSNHGGTAAPGISDLTSQNEIFSGDGVAVAISRDDPSVPVFVGFQNGPIYRRNISLPSGFGTNVRPAGSSSYFVTYFYLDPDNNKTLYYVGESKLFRTNNSTTVNTVVDGAANWTDMDVPTGFGTERISKLSSTWGTYNPATSYLLIGGNSGSVVRLDDPQNAALASAGVDITPAGASGVVTGLAIHPTNRNVVLLTYSNYGITNIYLTTNATAASPNWTVAERNLSSHSIRSAAITTNSAGEALYVVGTARGLYSSTNPVNGGSGVNWTREAPNLIGYAVASSMAYRPADNKLLIGTHGNGMFEATINHVLSIEDNEISESIKVYPNPVSDRLNLSMPNELSDNASFIINNILGQNVMRGTLENNQVDVNSLNTGIYFIQISSNGKNGVKRFIKK
jgi:hypothetical protein